MSEASTAHVCPVCGGTEWYVDFDETDADDDVRVDRCDRCDWPPNSPMAVEEYRAKRGIDPPSV